MKIIVNGQPLSVRNKLSAQELLEVLEIADKKLALEINQEIIPRSDLKSYEINEADKIEIIHAIGGG